MTYGSLWSELECNFKQKVLENNLMQTYEMFKYYGYA